VTSEAASAGYFNFLIKLTLISDLVISD